MKLIILCYICTYTIWGSTYYAIKEAVASVPPFYVVGLRFFLGGVLLGLFCMAAKKFGKGLNRKQILNALLVGTFLFAGGNGFVTVAEKRVDSYLAALLVSCGPFAILISDKLFLNKDVTLYQVRGFILGIIGIITLLGGDNLSKVDITLDIIYIFLGIISWAIGSSLSKKLDMPKDPFANACIQMSAVGAGALLLAQFYEPFHIVDWNAVTTSSINAILYLAIMGSIAICAFMYLLKHEPNSRIITNTFVNPIIAVFLGILVGKEQVVEGLGMSLLFILGALILIFYGSQLENAFRKKGRPVNS